LKGGSETMTRFEKVITDKKKKLKKILTKHHCPSEFGIENPKYCGHCEACWNEETEKEKATQEAAE
jgi:hypothetical protein